MGLRDTLRRSLFGDYSTFTFNGNSYPLLSSGPVTFTQQGQKIQQPNSGLAGYANDVYKSHGPVFALIAVRQLTFSSVEFKFQRLETRELFGQPALRPLEEPWPGGTTQNLLARTLVDADLSGNSYWYRSGGELQWWRPDWVDILLGERPNGTLHKIGFGYHEGGRGGDGPKIVATPDEVVHYMPLADPVSPWRGMSWITPIIREVMTDQASTAHQMKFFEQGASLNLAVTYPETMTPELFQQYKELYEREQSGVQNHYRTLHLGGGANLTPVGTSLGDLDLRNVQGGLETRLAAAAGVPVSVVGFREGNQGSALNASTYAQARRRFADGTLDPLWREAAGSFAKAVRVPDGARLWFDTRHVPFLREDAKDAAEIMRQQIGAVRQGVEAGFDPEAVVNAVMNDDLRQLLGQHSGLTSVQLQPPDNGDASEE